jgi:hypothetical protein
MNADPERVLLTRVVETKGFFQSALYDVSKLFRNVPFLTSLEVSPFLVFGFCLSFCFGSCFCRWPGPERSPAEPEGRSV